MGLAKTVELANQSVRTGISLTLLLAAVVGGYWGYSKYQGSQQAWEDLSTELTAAQAELVSAQAARAELQAQVAEQAATIETQGRELERLATAIRLLKVDHRVAQIAVRRQWTDEETGGLLTQFEFVEIDAQGRPLTTPQLITIEGAVAYIDAWVVKYRDEHVEQGDPLRSTSVCLFRRVFGENQKPSEGHPLDPVGLRPAAYSPGDAMTPAEVEIWENFWEYANDPVRAEEAGVRAAQGEAPSIQLQEGRRYTLTLRASGGLTIVADDSPSGE